ncbi:MAG: DUF3810 family protein [Ruminococcus sp.]|nr:DUF3810 family protein [Ruminococcus sp.]
MANDSKRSLHLCKSTWCMLSLVLLMLLLLLLAWCSSSFADWYAETCFLRISRVCAHIFGWIPCSVGEILIGAAIALVVLGPVAYLLCIIFCHKKHRRITWCFGRAVGWILTAIFVTETCCCFLLYHATPIGTRDFGQRDDYTEQELLALYSDLIDTANDLAAQVARDDNGDFLLQDDLVETAHAVMQKLGEIYPQFQGSYPLPKKIRVSYLMSQIEPLPKS